MVPSGRSGRSRRLEVGQGNGGISDGSSAITIDKLVFQASLAWSSASYRLSNAMKVTLACCLVVLLVSACLAAGQEEKTGRGAWNSGLSEFFRTVDSDGDGQIEPAEAMRYIGDSFGAELPEQDRNLAVQQMSQNLDGSDYGVTVSKAEVEQHLRTLLKVRMVLAATGTCWKYLPSKRYLAFWSGTTALDGSCPTTLSFTQLRCAGQPGGRVDQTCCGPAPIRGNISAKLRHCMPQ